MNYNQSMHKQAETNGGCFRKKICFSSQLILAKNYPLRQKECSEQIQDFCHGNLCEMLYRKHCKNSGIYV